jgi:hypothetical protein
MHPGLRRQPGHRYFHVFQPNAMKPRPVPMFHYSDAIAADPFSWKEQPGCGVIEFASHAEAVEAMRLLATPAASETKQ